MDCAKAKERYDLMLQTHWPYKEVEDWFGLKLSDDPCSLLAQYRIWAERYRPDAEPVDVKKQVIDRNLFELFLQHRGLVGRRSASVQWGMDEDSFVIVLLEALGQNLVSEGEAKGDFAGAYRSTLIADFHKRFPKLEKMTFSSYSGFIRLLHAEIKDTLGIVVAPLFCLTSQIVGEEPPDYACAFDCITNEAMGLGFQLWLETRKPIQLRPDSCSWATYFRFESLLKDKVLGQLDQQMESKRDVIKKHFKL